MPTLIEWSSILRTPKWGMLFIGQYLDPQKSRHIDIIVIMEHMCKKYENVYYIHRGEASKECFFWREFQIVDFVSVLQTH